MRRSLAALSAALVIPCSAAELTVHVTDADGAALPGAVVFLQSPAAENTVRPLAEKEMGQEHKTFLPDQLVITPGTAVNFPNRDTVRHHVYSFSPAKVFEIKLYIGTPAAPVVFDQPGVVVLGCNIHDDMVGWVVVVDTPWHAETDASGRATLQAVPSGSYRLRVWHRALAPGTDTYDRLINIDTREAISVELNGVRP